MLKNCYELEMATNRARPPLTPLDLDVCTVDKTGNKRFMPRLFDHVDLRVPRLAEVTAFYELLLPALGFTRRKEQIEGWLEFEAPGCEATAFFGITESAAHVVNENRIAFWAETAADVDRVAGVAKCAGARNVEGPMDYAPGYYAVFFEDPSGNRLEVCHRVRR